MSYSRYQSPAPEGQIAIVCCSPDNFHSLKEDKLTAFPENYKECPLTEIELNVFNEDIFRSALDCGFNVIMYPGSDLPGDWVKYTEYALDFCAAHGIKLIINSPILNYQVNIKSKDYKDHDYKRQWPRTYVEKFKKHVALGGWQIKDEPSYQFWHDEHATSTTDTKSTTISNVDNLESIKDCDCPSILPNFRVITQTDSRNMIFMNLAGSTDQYWIGKQLLENFLDEYIATFNPPLLSYDFYPIQFKIDENGKKMLTVDNSHMYEFLDIFSTKSKNTGKPFWAYCLCLAHDTGGAKYPESEVGMLRYEAFTALAHGAQGLVFWGYKQGYRVVEISKDTPKDPTNPNSELQTIVEKHVIESDEVAPLDLYGNKTDLWYNVRKVIYEISKFHNIFYNCEMTRRIICNGHGEEVNMNGDGGILKMRAMGKGVLISRIVTPDSKHKDRNGKPLMHKYIVVVSSDPFNNQEIDLYYENKDGVDKGLSTLVDTMDGIEFPVTPPTSTSTSTSTSTHTSTVTWHPKILAPGGYYILKY